MLSPGEVAGESATPPSIAWPVNPPNRRPSAKTAVTCNGCIVSGKLCGILIHCALPCVPTSAWGVAIKEAGV